VWFKGSARELCGKGKSQEEISPAGGYPENRIAKSFQEGCRQDAFKMDNRESSAPANRWGDKPTLHGLPPEFKKREAGVHLYKNQALRKKRPIFLEGGSHPENIAGKSNNWKKSDFAHRKKPSKKKIFTPAGAAQ